MAKDQCKCSKCVRVKPFSIPPISLFGKYQSNFFNEVLSDQVSNYDFTVNTFIN